MSKKNIKEQQIEMDLDGDYESKSDLYVKVLGYNGVVEPINDIKDKIKNNPEYELSIKDKNTIEKFFNDPEKYEEYYGVINEDEIESLYKKTVFDSIKKIYGNSNQTWGGVGERGPSGQGGVINVKSLNELLRSEDSDYVDQEGHEWSIINYFDTNPKVMGYVLWNFKKEHKLEIKGDLDKFNKWIGDNREKLFKNGYMFDHMVKLNFTSLKRGLKNEGKAIKIIEKLIGHREGDVIISNNIPGSTKDRSGVDFTIMKSDGSKVNFQAKPLNGYEEKDGVYVISSYKIRWIENKRNIDFFIFTSHNEGEVSDEVYIFENRIGEFQVNTPDEHKITFNYPPVKIPTNESTDKLIENFFDTGKLINEENNYTTHIGVGNEKLTFDEVYRMFFPFGVLSKKYPQYREVRETIKRKCLKSADGNVENAKDYCEEVFLTDISLFFRKGYHFDNESRLIKSVITKVGMGLIDLHRRRNALKNKPTNFKKMDDEYLRRQTEEPEFESEYSNEMVKQAIENITNEKHRFAIKTKYFDGLSQDEQAELWNEENNDNLSSGSFGPLTARGWTDFARELNILKKEEESRNTPNDDIDNYIDKFLDI
jgi:hypothetical protein